MLLWSMLDFLFLVIRDMMSHVTSHLSLRGEANRWRVRLLFWDCGGASSVQLTAYTGRSLERESR